MKKLLLIMLCLITLTGCGNEIEQKPTEPPTKQEEVEVNKYITIKLTLNEDCNTEKNDSCKVEKFTIENDKDNIFKDLDLNNTTYCITDKKGCSQEAFKTSTLKQIYDTGIQHNLNVIQDYRYLVNDKYKTTREIVLKPLDELKWNGKINLNENVVVTLNTNVYNEYENHCMAISKDISVEGKVRDPQTCGPTENGYPGGIKRKISNELINQVNSTPGRKYEGKGKDSLLDYETITISSISIPGNPRFYRNPNYTTWVNESDKGVKNGNIDQIYKGLYSDEALKLIYNPFNIDGDMDSTPEKIEYKILDEKICEEYSLTCDRW